MDRYTKRENNGNAVILGDSIYSDRGIPEGFRGDAIDLLAAYEDTGLEPEEIVELVYRSEITPQQEYFINEKADSIITGLKELLSEVNKRNHITELLKAEAEGRLLVLPCKVGDTVFYAFENEDVFCGKVYAISTCDGTNWFSVRYDSGLRYDHTWEDLGKTVFLTREEAKAKLKERGE